MRIIECVIVLNLSGVRMEATKRLRRILRRQKVSTMEDLQKSLEGRSQISIYRDLKELDYCSSYSHAGKYYTLSEVACFNDDGLWQYDGIGFSRYGTLKETVYHLVDNSDTGHHHEELQCLLKIRAHNTLLGLVCEKRLRRIGRKKLYLYVSGDFQRAGEQRKRREELIRAPTSVELTIEILAEVIRGSRICIEAAELTARLSQQGVEVTEQQVADVLRMYGVKKTLGSW